MKIFVGDPEREFFKKNGFILLEEVLEEREVDSLRLAAEHTRHKKAVSKDMALVDSSVAEVLFSIKIASIAFELSEKHTLRYGYDQFFRLSSLPKKISTSISPLWIGVCIALDSREEFLREEPVPLKMRECDLPVKKGDVLFFIPEIELDWKHTTETAKESFFFLLYASDRAMYTFHPDDPFTHDVKKMGYVFGDRVKEATHPILYR